jgi:hypothetical protein
MSWHCDASGAFGCSVSAALLLWRSEPPERSDGEAEKGLADGDQEVRSAAKAFFLAISNHVWFVSQGDSELWARLYVQRWRPPFYDVSLNWKHLYMTRDAKECKDFLKGCTGDDTLKYFKQLRQAKRVSFKRRKRNELEIVAAWRLEHTEVSVDAADCGLHHHTVLAETSAQARCRQVFSQ